MITTFAALLIFIAIYLYSIYRSVRGRPPSIRRVPGLDALEEAIGRGVELGKPIYYSTGMGRLSGGDMPMTMAALTLLGHSANLANRLGAELRYIAAVPELVPVSEDMLRTAYGESYKPEQVTFVPSQVALMSAIVGTYERERPAANFILGALYWETVVIAEAGARAGAMQIGGTGRLYQVPFTVALCDYSLIGEELLAAGAYVSREPSQLGSILASDLIRFIVMGLIGLYLIGAIIGVDMTTILRF